jgi:cation transport protein ChaC
MNAVPEPPAHAMGITRDRLHDGSLTAALRASAPPGTKFLSDAELAASLDLTLQEHRSDEDLFVFGYGSLMWNPAFHFADASKASVQGWHRRFCLWLYMARGSLQTPGLMLALDRGGACRGVAFRIPAQCVRDELILLWRREMLSGAYQPRWVTALVNGTRQRALTFVVNRRHERYVRKLSSEQVAHHLSTAHGSLGTNLAYFESTCAALQSLGIKDAAITRLRCAIDRRP